MCAEITAEVTEQSEQQVRLRVCREPCAGCDGKCLGMLFSRTDQNAVEVNRNLLEIVTGELTDGSQITVKVQSGTLIALSSLVYLVPLILMLLSAVVCEMMISQSDSAVAGSAAFGLAGGLLVVKTVLSRLDQNRTSKTLLIRPDKPEAL